MENAAHRAMAQQLAKARRAGARLDAYPGEKPADLAEAYLVQDRYIEAMGLPVVGWKVGCTSKAGQTLLNVCEPIAGPLFETLVHDSPASVSATLADSRIVEAEIAFRLAQALPARDTPYELTDVIAAIGEALPAFELANKRLPGGPVDAAEWLVADGAIDAALVVGRGVPFQRDDDLTAETVSVSVDRQHVAEGVGANALDGPLNVLLWLANHLSARGHGLAAGSIISTGLITEAVIGELETDICADFSTLGRVEMRLVAA